MNILYLAHRIPYPPNKGDKIRSFQVVNYLSRLGDVYLAALVDNPEDFRYAPELRKFCREISLVRISKIRKRLFSTRALYQRMPMSVLYFYEKSLQRAVNAFFSACPFDVIFCFSSPMAEYVFRSDLLMHRVHGVLPLLIMDSGKEILPALERIVRVYLIAGDYEKALHLTDKHLKENPDNLKIGLLKAEVLIRHESFETAEGFISDLLKRNPSSDRAAFLRGNLHRKYGNTEAAIGMFQEVTRINPQNAGGYIELAKAFQVTGRPEKAAETYESFLRTNGFTASIGNDLAYLYAEMNQNLDRALELAEKAREAMPQSPEVADTLGWVHLKRKSLFLAKEYLQQALRAQPDNPVFNYHVGAAQFEENDFSNSHQTLQKALKLSGRETRSYPPGSAGSPDPEKGNSYTVKLGLGKTEAASAETMIYKIEFTLEMIKTAEASEKSGEFEKAITTYEELIKKGGFIISAANRLARLYTSTGKNLDRAMELTEKVRTRQPDNAEAADTMGRVYLKRGSYLLAKRYFHEAITLAPNMPIFRYHLGTVLLLEKDFSEARKELETAISLGLGGEELEEARKILRDD